MLYFFSSQWLPEGLYFCQRVGFSDLYVLLAPIFCKIFLCLLWTSYFVYTGFPFVISSDSLDFLLALSTSMSLSATLLLWFLFPLIFYESFSFSFDCSIITACSNFSKYWYLCSPVAYLFLHSYFRKVFISSILSLSLSWFIFRVIIVVAAYIKFSVSVMSD